MTKITQDLQAIFQAGIDSVAGQSVVKKELEDGDYPKQFHVVAIGKAADAMLQGVSDKKIISALLITKHHHISKASLQNSKFICLESDHPIPKESSIKAGLALLDYLQQLPENEPCDFLISGGTSALVEVLNQNWDLPQLGELSRYLLGNTYSINEINAVRREISRIKGGGLWQFIQSKSVHCLMISDVKGDDPADIGSGLLFSKADNELPELPKKWLSKILDSNNKSSKTDSETMAIKPANFNWKIIASLDIAKQASAIKAKELGYPVKIVPDFIEGDASNVAINCVQTIRNSPNTLFIWGGETTIQLPENPRVGGRNQHLALSAAIEMDDCKGCYLLAAGTDGSDGTTMATGAIVTGETVGEGLQKQLVAQDYLNKADSNSYFKEIKEIKEKNALIETGPTGTNVMDLILGIRIV